MFCTFFEKHHRKWDILLEKSTGVMEAMKVTSEEKEQLSTAIDRMNEGLTRLSSCIMNRKLMNRLFSLMMIQPS